MFAVLALVATGCGDEEDANSGRDTGVDASDAAGDTASDAAGDAQPDGTADAAEDAADAPFPLAGTWSDDFGGEHVIDDTSWTQTYTEPELSVLAFDIEQIDADAQFVVARNSEDNAWSSGLWSRFDWTLGADDVWFCQSVFDAASADDAAAAARADDTDPSTTGCGGAPWTRLTPVVAE